MARPRKSENSERYLIPSVKRAVGILETLAYSKEPLTLVEISRRLNIPKTTAFHILTTLEATGLVQRKGKTPEYTPGLRLFEIGSMYLAHSEIRREAFYPLQTLEYRSNKRCHLAILDQFEVVYIESIGRERIGEPKPSPPIAHIGVRYPAYCLALGKVLLAYLPDEMLNEYLGMVSLTKFTPNTIDSKEELAKQLRKVRAQGYALDRGEYVEWVRCVAAPIFNSEEKAVAAISIAASVKELNEENFAEHIEMVQETAREISRRLGWGGLNGEINHPGTPKAVESKESG